MNAEEKNEYEVIEKCWAAVRGQQVISTITMRVPNDVDFDGYRDSAKQTLGFLGEVKSGELVVYDGEVKFLKQKTHKNRGKKPREDVFFDVLG